VRVFFKCENLQRGGAFKIRGASNFLLQLDAQQLGRGVVAYSSGNHAQAVALAARELGTHATLVMPTDAPGSKLEATRALGARIVTYDRRREDREAIAQALARESGAVVVPPFDHPWVVAGQGTAALELLEDVPELDALVAPLGGGGLLSGCAVAACALRRGIRIFGAEPESANDWHLSLALGRRTRIAPPDTVADGLRAPEPGELTFALLRERMEAVLLVSEEEIRETMRFLLTRLKLLVEPSGAVAAAAVLHRKLPSGIRSAGVVLSGGNVDLDFLRSL
ncbi:MAG: threonine/serine dehydratase, partial [Bryobacterales bacterium]|nr:threonine/serine dehydratase [Bryobacteraceae bacterium]MDW8131137.1 threonine/serine dehydratase [Bryobacterales bacterium]